MSRLAAVAPRLGPLIRLLGSDQNGEVSAAVAGLRRVLASEGLDLHDLAAHIESVADVAIPSADQLADWLALVDRMAAQGSSQLQSRDLVFLANIRTGLIAGRAPSPKQQKWLGDIQSKLKVRARAG